MIRSLCEPASAPEARQISAASLATKAWRRSVGDQQCLCGRPAVKWTSAGFGCERCLRLETWLATVEFRSMELFSQAQQRSWAARQAAPAALAGTVGFAPRVEDAGGELVVFGHGEYHLPVAPVQVELTLEAGQ